MRKLGSSAQVSDMGLTPAAGKAGAFSATTSLMMRDVNCMTVRRVAARRSLLLTALVLGLVGSMASMAVAVVPPFDFKDFSARSLDEAGNDYTVAGGHPHDVVVSFSIPTDSTSTAEFVKSTFVDSPTGFVGNPAAAARCTAAEILTSCPAASLVGTVEYGAGGVGVSTFPLFNMVPERGYPAQFAFRVGGAVSENAPVIVLYPRLRSRTGQFGITVASPGISGIGINRLKVVLFGVPSQRVVPEFGSVAAGGAPVPFLSNPADCLVASPVTTIVGDSWAHPGRLLAAGSADFAFPDLTDATWKTRSAPAPAVTGCDSPLLVSQFAPTMDVRPTPGTGSSQADAPSGFTVDLDFGQLTNDPTDSASQINPGMPNAPALKDATVTLPEGVAISPSAADGLDGCSDLPGPGDQVHYETTDPVSCPDASKVGSVEATSPLLARRDPSTDQVLGAEPVSGNVFIIKPHPGDLSPAGDQDGKFRLLIQIDSRKYGVNLKLPGIVTADRVTGRLTARFEDNPQLPAKHLRLTFKAGSRAALVNPTGCGTAKTTGVLTSWSRGGTRTDGLQVAGVPDVTPSSTYGVSWDGNGGGCPSVLPFGPSVSAGTLDTQARGSSPFSFDLTRGDRQDVITGVKVGLPGGLLASVKDVALCSDADANAGSCPAASRVGSATVAAGPGDTPFYLRGQPVSLTGPYKGAPYGLAIAVHAEAGPFDLGTVVVRQALNVDVDDVHATVVSDPLPTIRDGVPFRVRRVHVDVDRPGFMQSPSSCDPLNVSTSVFSAGGQTASLNTPLRFTGCERLPFAPKLQLSLTGKKQTRDGGHPNLKAVVKQKRGEAGIEKAVTRLPLSLALDPDNAQALCEFEHIKKAKIEDFCPKGSIIGRARAVSPLLKKPLAGNVYFVKNRRINSFGNSVATLPALVVALRGEVAINLKATSSLSRNRLVNTFDNVPDAPISQFNLNIKGGKNGILVVVRKNICSRQVAEFQNDAHSGKRHDRLIKIKTPCNSRAAMRKAAKKRKAAAAKRRAAAAKRRS